MKPVLFIDFDGTLCHDKFWRSLSPELLSKIKLFEFDEEQIAQRWMRGEFTSEEINRRVAPLIGMDYQELWDLFVENCSTMEVSKDLLETLSNLRSRYHVVLMTDNMDSFDQFTVPALHLEDYFDLIVNSYNKKRGKEDESGKNFTEVLQSYDSAIEDSILIDNSAQACQLFESLGGTSYLVSGDQNLGYWLAAKIV